MRERVAPGQEVAASIRRTDSGTRGLGKSRCTWRAPQAALLTAAAALLSILGDMLRLGKRLETIPRLCMRSRVCACLVRS
jgi:hypothetical protein